MRRIAKTLSVVLISLLLTLTPIFNISETFNVVKVEAHSGRTDSSGGHKDNKNKSGLGSYHYHCGGYSAHLHSNGKCPYSSNTTTSKSTTKASSSSKKSKTGVSSDLIKKVQKELNELGYDCGKADGIQGKNTTKALKEFQKDNSLTVDGKIGKQVKQALNIE